MADMIEFESFYLNTKNIIYQYLYQHVEDFHETEDIAQEAYLKAFEVWDELQNHPNPAGWLVQTVKYLCKNFSRYFYYRLDSYERYAEEDISYFEPAYNVLVMEDLLESVYNKKESAIAKKYFLQDDSVEELAEDMGVTSGSMRTRLYRMRRRLKQYVESCEKVW